MTRTDTPRKRLAVRLSVAERAAIDDMAGACGLTAAEFLRRAALGQRIAPQARIPAANLKTYAELGKIGANVNQIAKALHEGLPAGDGAQRIAQALPGLVTLIREVRTQLTTPPGDPEGAA